MKLDKFTIFVLVTLGIFLLWLYGVFAYGYAFVKLWTWFVVPVFHPDINIGIMQAAGLFMFIRFLTADRKMPVNDPKESSEVKAAKVLLPMIIPWVAILFGWMLKSLIG